MANKDNMEEYPGSTMCHQITNSALDDQRDNGSGVAQIIKSKKKTQTGLSHGHKSSCLRIALRYTTTWMTEDLHDRHKSWGKPSQTCLRSVMFKCQNEKHLVLHVLTSQLSFPACTCLFQLAPFLSATHSVTYACVAAPKLPAFPNTACL